MRVSYAGQILFCVFGTNIALHPPSQLRRGAHEIIGATRELYPPSLQKLAKQNHCVSVLLRGVPQGNTTRASRISLQNLKYLRICAPI